MAIINDKINIACDGEPPIFKKIRIKMDCVSKPRDYPQKYELEIYAADGGDPLAGDGINDGIALIVAL